MTIEVDPHNNTSILVAQKRWLDILQDILPNHPILIKVLEGGIPNPRKDDHDLYDWMPYSQVWEKVKQPIYTRGILPCEILIDPDVPDWNKMRTGMNKLASYCSNNGIPYILGFSGGKGVHMSIIFGDIRTTEEFYGEIERYEVDAYKIIRSALLNTIADRAGVNLEDIGLDRKKINFRITKRGSQIRTFGTMRGLGQYKTLIEKIPDRKPEPYELPLIFPDKVEVWEIKDTEYNEIAINAIGKEIEKAKHYDENSISDMDLAGTSIMKFPCIKRLHEIGVTNGRYYAGQAVLLMCKRLGLSKEETLKHMRVLFETFPGISQEDIELRINNAMPMYEQGFNFSCKEIKELFPEHNLCDFSNCPIKVKIDENKERIKKETQEILIREIREKLCKMPISGDKKENVDKVTEFALEDLAKLDKLHAVNILHTDIKEKFHLSSKILENIERELKKVITAREKEEEAKLTRIQSGKINSVLTFGKTEDAASNAIAVLTGEFLMKYKPIFFLGGDLYSYENGVYITGETVNTDAKKFIYTLANEYGVNISPSNVNKVLKRVYDSSAISSYEINKTPERIVVNNGILDTKNRILYDHNPEEKHIIKISVDYDPEAKITPEYEEFLKTTFEGVEWQIPVVQEMFGFCLYKEYFIEKFFFLVGDGGNGRSILLNILTEFLGMNNIAGMTLHEVCKPPDLHTLISLHGKLANLCGETGTGELKDLANIKRATGGDLIRSRDLYKPWIEFYNYAKFIFSMNEPPIIFDGTRGRKRRMVILDFPVKFEAGKNAKDKEVLKAELLKPESLSGILNWALEGLDRLLKNREFSDERSEAIMTLDYERKSNPVRYFVHDHVDDVMKGLNNTRDGVAFAASRVTEAQIMEAYTAYAKKNNLPSLNKTKIMSGVKSECERVGYSVKLCRDRYTLDKDGKPNPREVYFKGIELCGLDQLGLLKQPSKKPETTEPEENRTVESVQSNSSAQINDTLEA